MTLSHELSLAESALRAGDKRHAAMHAAGALALAPDSARALELVDQLLDEPPPLLGRIGSLLGRTADVAPLFPSDGYYGHVAVRARAHWRRKELDQAFSLLTQVQLAVPHVDYQRWLIGIASDAEATGHALDIRPLFSAYAAAGDRTMGLLKLRPGERAALAPWPGLAQRLLHSHRGAGGESAHALAIAASGLLRRAGRFEQAAAAVRHLADGPAAPEPILTQLGLALRACADYEGAAEAFARAEQRFGTSSHRAEIGRVRYDQGRFDQALAAFEAYSGEVDPEIDMAMDACRLALGLPTRTQAVQSLFGRVPAYDELRRGFLGDGSAVAMSDATTNGLASVIASGHSVEGMRMGVSSLECPSVLLCFALFTRGTTRADPAAYSAPPPARDPVAPLGPLGAKLWVMEQGLPCPALPPPPPELQALLTHLIQRPQPAMSELLRAAKGAPAHSFSLEELYRAMVNPPRIPAGCNPAQHVFGWQRACAMLIAVKATHEPWLRSQRRDGLRALVLGAPDWITAAALLALTEVLLDEPEALPDAREWLDTLLAATPEQGHCPWATAAAHLFARVGGLRKDLLQPLAPWLEPGE